MNLSALIQWTHSSLWATCFQAVKRRMELFAFSFTGDKWFVFLENSWRRSAHAECWSTIWSIEIVTELWWISLLASILSCGRKLWIKTLLLLLSRWWVDGGGVIGLCKEWRPRLKPQVPPPPLPFGALGEIKTKWIGAIVIKQLAPKYEDGLRMDARANEWQTKWILLN